MSSDRTGMQARHGEMLAEVADMSLALARKLHERAMAAETDEEVQAAAAAFHRISRSLRQTLALEARLEREAKREAVEDERRAEETRRERVKARRTQVDTALTRLVWTENERPDRGELIVEARDFLAQEACGDTFLDGPVEAVIARILKDLGLPANDAAASPPPLAGEETTPADEGAPDWRSSA